MIVVVLEQSAFGGVCVPRDYCSYGKRERAADARRKWGVERSPKHQPFFTRKQSINALDQNKWPAKMNNMSNMLYLEEYNML